MKLFVNNIKIGVHHFTVAGIARTLIGMTLGRQIMAASAPGLTGADIIPNHLTVVPNYNGIGVNPLKIAFIFTERKRAVTVYIRTTGVLSIPLGMCSTRVGCKIIKNNLGRQ